jgi:UDP-N-acetylglucosamine--N-acetylmuramyl-(pentapeptide) pyrophosphoryl-undecaprenol N-acetylglucosamine transferase
MSFKKRKILFSGGGTAGSVTPLLAIIEELRQIEGTEFEFLWLGTKSGIEREMVSGLGLGYHAVPAGKFRRYFSLSNIIDPFFIIAGFFRSLSIIYKWRPNLVISAGAFISVPVIWAAWFLRIPILIHQQDARPGLANRLMAPFARVITVALEKSLKDYGPKAFWTGNPVREKIKNINSKIKDTASEENILPTVLVVGGGTGAAAINNLVAEAAADLLKFCQVILVAGKTKISNFDFNISNLKVHDFLDSEQMAEALGEADIVVSRCGMNFLTELSYLGKPAIIIPIPGTHQEDNAEIFYRAKAALVLDQNDLTPEKFVLAVKKLVYDENLRRALGNNIWRLMKSDANKNLIEVVRKYIN